MQREFVLTILTLSLLQSTKGAENPRGKCYNYNEQSAPPNCCDRTIQESPCNTVRCQAGYTCELVPNSIDDEEICNSKHSPLKPECRLKCDRPKSCKRGCHRYKDLNGCSSCYCDKDFTNPCFKKPCNGTDVCSLQEVICVTDPCHPIANCSPRNRCPRIRKCPINCLKFKDHDGCSRCYCCNGCVNKKCPRGKRCVLEQMICIQCPCPVLPKCV